MEISNKKSEGEALLILVRRSGMTDREVAQALDLTPATLSRHYKRQALKKKVRRKAAAFFNVPEDYFSKHQSIAPAVAEPPAKYMPRPEVIARLEKENAQLKKELEH